MHGTIATNKKFALLVAALLVAIFAGLPVLGQAPPSAEPVSSKDATTHERFMQYFMGKAQISGAAVTLTENADGSFKVETNALIKIKRLAGGQVDEFSIKIKEASEFDSDWKLISMLFEKQDAGVTETRKVTISNNELTFTCKGPGTDFSKTVGLPEDFSTNEAAFAELLPKFKKDGKEISKTFKTIDMQSQNEDKENTFVEQSLTIRGKKQVEHGGKTYHGYDVRMAQGMLVTDMVVDENYLAMSMSMAGGRMTGKWVDESPFEFESEEAAINSMVPVDHPIKEYKELEQMTVEVTVDSDDPSLGTLFEDNRYQTAKGDAGTYTLTLKATRLAEDYDAPALPFDFGDNKEVSRYLAPTPLCQSEDGDIVAQAKKIVGDNKDSVEVVRSIVDWVNGYLVPISGNRGNATAVEVLKAKKGDCTEHAALTVALCRAVGIPARNVSGLVYLSPDGDKAVAGFHAWAEVWVGKWMAVDATIPETGTSARYIWLGYDEPGESTDGQARLARCIGQISLKIKGYKHFGKDAVTLAKGS